MREKYCLLAEKVRLITQANRACTQLFDKSLMTLHCQNTHNQSTMILYELNGYPLQVGAKVI
jgi:hypothetical protein